MKRRFLILVFISISAGCAPQALKRGDSGAGTRGPSESSAPPPVVIKELRPGIWLHTSYSPEAPHRVSNGLVVREGKQVVLIDTAWGNAATEDLLVWIKKNVRLPVERAIITHAHEDRMGGAGTLARHGIQMMSHPLTRQRALARGWTAPSALDVFASSDIARVGFLEIYFPGPGHAPDNVVVWIASERMLFGGCAIRAMDAKDLGNVSEADLNRWTPTVKRIEERYPAARTVVPGHGDPGGRELIGHTRALLAK